MSMRASAGRTRRQKPGRRQQGAAGRALHGVELLEPRLLLSATGSYGLVAFNADNSSSFGAATGHFTVDAAGATTGAIDTSVGGGTDAPGAQTGSLQWLELNGFVPNGDATSRGYATADGGAMAAAQHQTDSYAETSLVVLLRQGTGLSTASLNGAYNAVLWDTPDGNLFSAGLATVNFNGQGNAGVNITSVAQGQGTGAAFTVGTTNYNYTVGSAGAFTLGADRGGWVSGDGSIVAWTKTVSSGAQNEGGLNVAVRPGTGHTAADLHGVYHLMAHVANGTDVFSSGVATYTFDGAGHYTSQFTGVADGTPGNSALSTAPSSGTYSVSDSGALVIDGQITGYLNADGSFAALATVPGDAARMETGMGVLVRAPDASVAAVVKTANYTQEQDGLPTLNTGDGYELDAVAMEASAGQVSSASVTPPGGSALTLTEQQDDLGPYALRFGSNGFASAAALNAAYPNGTYQMSVVGVHDGAHTLSVNLTGDAYPNAPHYTNWPSLNGLTVNAPFTVTWDPMSNGTTDDYIQLGITDHAGGVYGSDVYQSGRPGAADAMDGTATQWTIPAGTLAYGHEYEAWIEFIHIVNQDTTNYPAILTAAAYDAGTSAIFTTGPSTAPIGAVDVADLMQVTGWAYDADAGNGGADPISVRLEIDGQMQSPVIAGQTRNDLTGYLGSANHGFSLDPGPLGVGSHTVKVFAVGTPDGTPVQIGTTRTIVNHAPIGAVNVSGTTVVGWAFDADAANSGANAIQVRLDIDNQTGTPLTADVDRPDLQGYLGSTAHGFAVNLNTLAVGTHLVKVYAIDVASGSAVLLGTKNVTRLDAAPIGSLDICDSRGIIGWAFDADAGSTPIQIRVDVDGQTGTLVTANLTRNDLTGYLGSANHGYNVPFPTLTPGTHTIKVYALGTPDATPRQLGTTRTISNHAPIGSVTVTANGTVLGWAYDADAGNGGADAVQVRVDVDGQTGTPFAADLARSDLQSYLGSANHGFVVNATVIPVGTHQVQVYVLDAPSGAATLLADRSITKADTAPIGSLDICDARGIIGWAFDADAGATAIQVRVDVDGQPGTPTTANLTRNDLQSYLGSANHGYNIPLPTLSFGTHTIKVYALGTPDATPRQLGSTHSITNHAPIGAAGTLANGVLYGWAYDADAGAGSIQVRIDIDGSTGTPFTANVTRSDLQSYLGSPDHGFAFTLPTLSAGSHTLRVYAIDSWTGQAVLVGTKTVDA